MHVQHVAHHILSGRKRTYNHTGNIYIQKILCNCIIYPIDRKFSATLS